MININIDLAPVDEYIKIHEELVRQLQDSTTTNNVVKALARSTTAGFNSFADMMATAKPKYLHHVYEWGQLGTPEGRLFRTILVGRGKERVLNYDFKASQKTVPVGIVNTGIENDYRKQVHIFYWKAPILEERTTPITIYPGIDKGILAFPKNGKIVITKQPIVQQYNRETHGQFALLWSEYWSKIGEEISIEDIKIPTEISFKTEFPRIYSNISHGRARASGVRINVNGRKNHKRYVDNFIDSLHRKYLRAARAREAISGDTSSDGD